MPDPTPTTPPAPPAAPPAPPATPPAAPPAAPPQGTPAAPPAAPPSLLTTEPPPPTAPPATGEIKVTLPEGMTANQKLLDQFLPLAKDAKLTSEQAQKFVDLHVQVQKAAETEFLERITKWAEESKSDPEIGGANFDANLALSKKVLDRIGTPGLKAMLQQSGLGNHKDVIRMFATIGKVISEDRLPGAAQKPAEGSREQMIAEAFPNSPDMGKK